MIEVAVLAYLLGAIVILGIEARLRRDEWPGLLLWPIAVPVFWAWLKIKRWRWTCPEGRYFGDREHYLRHMKREHS